MTFIFIAVLYLGLNLGQETSVLEGYPHKPTLSVQPGLVVARGKQVTISCEVTTGAQEYRLYKEGGPHPWRTQNTPKATNKAQFLIPSIEQRYGGIYRCYYKTPAGWSEHSDPLELSVTGLYSKPSLSIHPSNVVNSGETVTLQCVSSLGFNRFILTKEGEQKPFLIRDSEFVNSTGQFQGLFPVGPVTLSQRWIFRCYGYHINSPQVWSEPSDLLEIYVSVSQPQDYTMENLIRMGVSILVLVLLGILLFEAQHSQRRTQHASGRKSSASFIVANTWE
ncbi:leukocyte immunoglobulin-like receptor subfamily A member 5 isoform X1 [Mastomys coucha]|uniref:leukocyte immunoglobulin-like receptor subfamily A member 5 isoform X1 n=1 Tax=Mastomys coucha TaxID=35658 RepID=UPI0012626AE9|nr:leukocyte immunoglobulin-like receptor subfamily A member 5 isoform X1 [Mastomys coucha]